MRRDRLRGIRLGRMAFGASPEGDRAVYSNVIREARNEQESWHVTTSELHRTIPGVLELVDRRHGRMTSLSTHSATLEDVFVELTRRD